MRLFAQPLSTLEPRFLVVLCSLALICLGGGSWAVSKPGGGKAVRKK